MATKSTERSVATEDGVLAELRTANRLLAILATRGMEPKDAIALLHGLSFPPRAIAAALSMTPNAVSIAIHRMKKADTVRPLKTGEDGKGSEVGAGATE